jgi:hypothetical protein
MELSDLNINIDIDIKDVGGHYSNMLNISGSTDETLLSFVFLDGTTFKQEENSIQGKMVSRIIVSPNKLKEFRDLIDQYIKDTEAEG